MTKNYSIALFCILVSILFALVFLHTGSIRPPSGSDSIWFHAGLFTLLVGTFIMEYRFTKPNDVFVNCLIVFASVSTLTNPPHEAWWELLRWGSLLCGIAAIAISWDSGSEARINRSAVRTIVYQLITKIGSAKVIFSFVFILSLVSYFDLQKSETKIFVIAWGVFLLAALIDFPQMFGGAIRWRSGQRNVIGVTHSFLAPSIVYCERIVGERAPIHQIVGFCQTVKSEFHTYGLVIGTRASASENRVAVALLNSSIDEDRLNSSSLLVALNDAEIAQLQTDQVGLKIAAAKKIVGTVAKGSTISQLRFEIIGRPNIVAGSLLRVQSSENLSVYYQVFEGIVEEEDTMHGSARAFVAGRAEQIGCWDSETGGFHTHDWVAPERSCVHLVDEEDGVPSPAYVLRATEKTIGVIPNSSYPVTVDLKDLVLYHSAILGVTGSGKSFLTFSLIESCAANGIKVVCVDPTGDYQRYVTGAVMLTQGGALDAFLNSERMIGIIETGRVAVPPIRQAQIAANRCLSWCKENRSEDDILSPRPKVLVVFEEAHLLVPEWNFNPERSLQDIVSETSQIVLQARKFGLGFIVVSQRTANVVKSILNQCNTMFSFQAFDETGFDFLKNYMGSFHVGSLPNLKSRHGIVVGKASKSRRPIMVHFEEQMRALQTQPAPEMPLVQPLEQVPEIPAADLS